MRDIMSQLAEGSYEMGKKNTSQEDKVKAANEKAARTDYVVNSMYSDANITTYQHKDNPKDLVIAHRGTDIHGKKGRRDIQSDVSFALGIKKGYKGRFDRRMKRTEDIIDAIEKEHGKLDSFHMTGHSLGGGTVNHAIANSEKIRSKLTAAHTFNAAANPLLHNDQKVSKKVKKQLEGKVSHHRIDKDPVSVGFKTNTPFGKVKTYKNKSKAKNLAEKGLDAHGMTNFTGSIPGQGKIVTI